MIDLTKMIDSFTHRHVFIQTHNFPDPDAIASAYGLQYLLHSRVLNLLLFTKEKLNTEVQMQWLKSLVLKSLNILI